MRRPDAAERAKEYDMSFVTSSDGTPVILVGGAFQYRAIDHRTTEIAAQLAVHHTVVHYDRRGRGDSGDALFMTECVGVPAEVVAGFRQTPKWAELASVAHTVAYDLTLLAGTVSGDPLPTDRWAAVTVPTLVIDGGASPPQMAS